MENSRCDQFADTIVMEDCGSMTYTLSTASLDTDFVKSGYDKSARSMQQQSLQDAGIRFIERSSVKLGKQIGKGGQGIVYEASVSGPYTDQCKESKSMKMAVKKFNSKLGMSQGQYPVELWNSERDYVLRPTAFFVDDDESLCMLMPLYSGDLRTAIDNEMKKKINGQAPFEEFVTLNMICQLALGMEGLHSTGVCHRDLKASNILLMSAPLSAVPIPMPVDEFEDMIMHLCHIADFEDSKNVKGTAFWRAPEVLRSIRTGVPLTSVQWQAADVYSFGMLCYEIVTGEIPFYTRGVSDYNIVLNGGRPELPDHVPEVLRNIITECWHPNPKCRPDFGKILGALKLIPNVGLLLDQWEKLARLSNAKSENLYLELMELEEIVQRHYEVNDDENRGFQNFDWGQKFFGTVKKFMEVARKGHQIPIRDTHPLSFVDYIECQKLEVLMNYSFFEFWSTLEPNHDTKQFIKRREDRGLLYMDEKARMTFLSKKIFKELHKRIELIQLKDNDNDLTLKEKLEVVHDLVRDVKCLRRVEETLQMVDNILKKIDPGENQY